MCLKARFPDVPGSIPCSDVITHVYIHTTTHHLSRRQTNTRNQSHVQIHKSLPRLHPLPVEKIRSGGLAAVHPGNIMLFYKASRGATLQYSMTMVLMTGLSLFSWLHPTPLHPTCCVLHLLYQSSYSKYRQCPT